MKNKVFDASEPVGGNEVLKFGAIENARSVLDQIIQDGARRMLQLLWRTRSKHSSNGIRTRSTRREGDKLSETDTCLHASW